MKEWAPELRRWFSLPIEHLPDMCKDLGSIPVLRKKENNTIDYVRKGRGGEMGKGKITQEKLEEKSSRQENRTGRRKPEGEQDQEAEAPSLLGPNISSDINKFIYSIYF